MRFGILYNIDYHPEIHNTPQQYYETILDQVELIERLGYDSAWFSEHHCSGYSFGNPAVIAGAASMRTRTIRLGIGVSLVPLHDPMQLAEEYAMVDNLSRGRLEYGIGRGFLMQEYHHFGVPIDQSHGRYREGTDVIVKAWTSDGVVNHEGEFFSFENYEYFPRPAQRPHPPIFASGSGTPDSYLWAASRGHHLGTSLFLPDHDLVKENVAAYRASLAEHGFDPRSREVAAVTQMFCANSKEEAMREGGKYALNYYSFFHGLDRATKDSTVPDFYASPDISAMDRNNQVLFGSPGELVERLQQAEEFFDIDFILMEVAQGGAPPKLVDEVLTRFGEEVIPKFSRAGCPPER